ncbi:adenylate/guanylate cyclase domain-containing protein [Pedobacter vanadiisoli]|uniref:Adenylate/guanylate cyclase domain-containing protein n=1 Tax=Pedobacter vanadiisoli TaxID=1761975 RepID=A0ABW5MJG6_9SPHI
MGLNADITTKVKDILDTNFNIEDVLYVPEISNSKLTFNNTGLRFEATTLFIDLRNSTGILNAHNKSTIAKIHKAYLHTTVKIATSLGGEVRSFNGDSVLAFFQGTNKNTLSNAVKAAMRIKYMIANSGSGINSLLAKYSAVDFGIGLDDGKILCAKVGVGGDANTKDLIWIGNAVNKAVVISDECKSPEHIGISSYVYANLNDDVKYGIQTDYWGNKNKVNMWTPYYVMYNSKQETFYKTSWHWVVS